MIRIKTIIICLITHLNIVSQIPESDSRKIQTILGSDFQQLETNPKYPYSDLCPGCTYVPSLTLYKDTTGVVFNNEFLLFRHPLAYTDGHELMKLINMNYVTVKEYNEFQEYVRDSIAREKLHYRLEDDEEANEFLIIDIDKVDRYGFKGPYYGKRELNREKYPLNWNKKFSYHDMQYIPILADMYLPIPQRYYRQRKFDDRKINYRYSEKFNIELNSILYKYHTYDWAENMVSTFSNSYLWSTTSMFDRDVWNVLGQKYNTLFPNENVIGLTGAQAKAFCNWKQNQIQKQLSIGGLNYKVIVSLPLKEDLSKISNEKKYYVLESKDYTSTWRITVSEYNDFLDDVRDSVLTEELFNKIPVDEDKIELLHVSDFIFSESRLEYLVLNPSDADKYRKYFNLKHSGKMERKYASIVDEIRSSAGYKQPTFVYWLNDAHSRSVVGNLVPDGTWVEGRERDSMYFEIIERDSVGFPIGLDYPIEFLNGLGHSTGVRSHEDLSRFYHRKEVSVSPKQNEEQGKDELIQGLTYEQAVAFYYWKYPIQFAKERDDWHQYVMPSKEQFERVQRGETVIVPGQTVEYPSPVFRYVVHIFPLL